MSRKPLSLNDVINIEAARAVAMLSIHLAITNQPTQLSMSAAMRIMMKFDPRVVTMRHDYAPDQPKLDAAILDAGVDALAHNRPITIVPWSVAGEWVTGEIARKPLMKGSPALVDMWIADTTVLVLERARAKGVKLPA